MERERGNEVMCEGEAAGQMEGERRRVRPRGQEGRAEERGVGGKAPGWVGRKKKTPPRYIKQ